MAIQPICDDPGATDYRGSRGGHLRSNEVTIRFVNKSRQDGDGDAQMVPNDLAR